MDIMNIGSMASSISAQSVNNDVEVLMMKKSLDTFEDTGAGITKMMEQSVNPHIGQNIDYSV